MGQVGIPLFYLQGMGGGAVLKFRDLFNDSSLYWGWRRYLGLTPAGKNGLEALGRYQLSVNPTINGEWNTSLSQAPRIFMGINSYPCEIITRLDTFSRNHETYAGLFIAKDPLGFGADLHFSITQLRSTTENGVVVMKDGISYLASNSITTLPMWLKIRIGCSSYRGLNIYFDFSEDGLNWVNLHVENTSNLYFSLNPASVGLYVGNFPTHNEVVGTFDHFIMKPKSIN